MKRGECIVVVRFDLTISNDGTCAGF